MAVDRFWCRLFPSAHRNRLASAPWGTVLPVVGIALGFVVGTTLADFWFGWSSWTHMSPRQLFLSALISAVIGVVVTYYFYSQGKNAHLAQKLTKQRAWQPSPPVRLLGGATAAAHAFNTPWPICACSLAWTRSARKHAGPHHCLPPAQHAECVARQPATLCATNSPDWTTTWR